MSQAQDISNGAPATLSADAKKVSKRIALSSPQVEARMHFGDTDEPADHFPRRHVR
jgi:hypothetical protein